MMTSELTHLTYVTAFTAVLWAPYVTNRVLVGKGVLHEVGYPDEPTRLSPWAERLKRAHANAVENLVVFAALVLVAHAAGVGTPGTVLAAQVFLAARVAHATAFVFAIPWLRTLAFSVGWGCQIAFVWALLAH
jgi:uncharacterized MAPEG superfamily protein